MNGILAGALTTLGIMTVFVTIGLFINSIGGRLLDVFGGENYIFFQFWEGVLLVILGGFIALKLNIGSKYFDKMSSKVQIYIQKFENPFVLSYLIGLFFAILAAPCAFIVFGTLISYVILNPGIGNAITLNLVFSLGAGIPFLVMGLLIPNLRKEFIQNSDRLIKWVPIITGLIVLLVGMSLMFESLDSGYLNVL